MKFRFILSFALLLLSLTCLGEGSERAYGVRVFDQTGTPNAIVSFYTDNPSYIVEEYPLEGLTVRAAAYANGAYYLMIAPSYTCDSLVRVDMATGQRQTVAVYRLKKDLAVRLIVTDMTYDSSTAQFYALAVDVEGVDTQNPDAEVNLNLYTIDPATGEAKLVGGQAAVNLVTIAADANGYLYGVDANGTLWSVNKRNGKPEEELAMAEVDAASLQSADFNAIDGTMYWTRFSQSGQSELWKFVFGEEEIVPSRIGEMGNGAEIIGLHIDPQAESPSTPAAPTGIKAVAGGNGELKAALSWKNPSVDQRNEALQGNLTAKVYRNGEPVATLDGMQAGQICEWTDNAVPQGLASYQVAIANSQGEGRKASASEIYVGEDALGSVEELKAERRDGNVAISWSKPRTGVHGGWIGNSAVSYKVVRTNDGLVIAESTENTSVIDTNISLQDGYTYSVTASNGMGAGFTANTNKVVAGPAASVPYQCDFSTEQQARLWTVVDGDGDGETWYRDENYAGTSDWFMKYMSQTLLDPKVETNDWIISAPIHLEAGKYYTLGYSIRLMSQNGLFPCNYSVTLGTDNTVEAQSKVLSTIDGEENMMVFTPHSVAVQVEKDGDYTLGFQLRNRVPAQITGIELTEASGLDLALGKLDGTRVPMQGAAETYTVNVINRGGREVAAYSLSLVDETGAVLAVKKVSKPLAAKATAAEELVWTPETKGSRRLACKVALPEDADTGNDMSDTIKVVVTESGVWKSVGTGTNTSYYIPFGCYSNYTAAQTIYHKEAVGIAEGQKIEGVIYPYGRGAGANIAEYDLPVKVLAALTDQSDMAAALDEDAFSTVYEGTVYLSPDRQQTEIVFDTPIEYRGGNLCLMTINNNGSMVPGYVFLSTKTADVVSSQYYQGTTPFDWEMAMKGEQLYANATFLITGQPTGVRGIADAADEAGVADVFSISGQLIRKGVPLQSATDGLRPGIYIVGNKKIVVR